MSKTADKPQRAAASDHIVTLENLGRALDQEGLSSEESHGKHTAQYCMHAALSALCRSYELPFFDLGVGRLAELHGRLDDCRASVRAAIEAVTPVLDRSRRVIIRVLNFGQKQMIGALEAITPKLNGKTDEPSELVTTAIDEMLRIVSHPTDAVSRRLTPGEVLDVLNGRRVLPYVGESLGAPNDLILRPPNQIKPNRKTSISGVVPAQERVTRLLSELGLYSEENVKLAWGWGVNYGFMRFRKIDNLATYRRILKGELVHRDSARPVPAQPEQSRGQEGEDTDQAGEAPKPAMGTGAKKTGATKPRPRGEKTPKRDSQQRSLL